MLEYEIKKALTNLPIGCATYCEIQTNEVNNAKVIKLMPRYFLLSIYAPDFFIASITFSFMRNDIFMII